MSDDSSPSGSGGADAGARSPLRLLLVGIAGVALLAVAYYAIAMPGMDHGSDAPTSDTPTSDNAAMDHGSAGDMSLGPDAFAARLGVDDAVVINVHTPYEGEIEGTDETLMDDGYMNVTQLEGGMRAWQAGGRRIISR
jgi:rhodanese-related sulfurtransferase